MTRLPALLLFGLLALVGVSGAVAGGSTARPPWWDIARDVPGMAALDSGTGWVNSVSCPAVGNCGAGGAYTDGAGKQQAFVVDETNGSWVAALEVPGTTLLNKGGSTSVNEVSCPTAGNCAAGGYYYDGAGKQQAFVVDETNGSWGNAIEVPGTAAVNTGGNAGVTSVSCPTAGNCTAGGHYQDAASGRAKAFVVTETNGSWGNAIEVPGTESLSGGGTGWASALSCPSPGNCTASGYYHDAATGFGQAWVADETNGSWNSAIGVPGTAALNTGGDATARTVSCASAGNCAVAGYYKDASAGHDEAYVANETNGTWGTAIQVPGTASFDNNGAASVRSVACSSPGNCTAGGYYADGSGATQAFVVDETSGTWGTATEVPGTATLNDGGNARATTVSCASAGNCAAGGFYVDDVGDGQAFVAAETNGVWNTATELPGTAALNGGGDAAVDSVSCPAAGECTAGGFYNDDFAAYEPFVASSAAIPAQLVGLNGVTVATAGGAIDSFDSSAGAYGAPNHGSAALVMSNGALDLGGVALSGAAASTQGSVTVSSTASVSGDVTAGTTASVAGPVGGTVTQNSPSAALAWPAIPACSPYSPKYGISGHSFSYSPGTGNLKVKMGTVKLASGTYCFNNVTLGAKTKLVVNGPVVIRLTGKLTATKGSIVNKTSLPADLEIETSYAAAGGLALAGDPHAYMTIVAPLTSVTISGGPVFGKLLAGTVSLSGSASFHADTH